MKSKSFLLRIVRVALTITLLGIVYPTSTAQAASIIVSPTSGLITTETGDTAEFDVVLDTLPTDNVTIGLSSSDTGEGIVSPSSVTFTPGNWNIAQTVTVTGQDDDVVDGDIGYTIVTAPASSADGTYNGVDPANVSVTNTDNDTAGITVDPTSGLTTTEAGGTDTFTIVLTSQPTADVTIGLNSSDTSEGTVSPGSVTFTSANWNIAQTVTAAGVDDAVVDGPVGYTIVTAAATSADGTYNGVDPANVSVTNTDNDAAGITVDPTSGLTTTEAGGTDTFTIVLTSQPTADVTIGLNSSDTSEGTVSPGSVTFTSANWNIAQTVTAAGVDDAVVDGPVGFTIVTAAATSADGTYNGVDPSNVSVTNIDNDTAGITVDPTSGLTTTEAGGTDTFTIVLTSQPTADVTIGLNSSDTSEGTVSPGSVTFTSANWNIAQTVTAAGVDDAVVDGPVGFTIVTAAATSADGTYNGVDPANVSVTNTDNDTAGINVSPAMLFTNESGTSANFGVVLTSQPTALVTIALTNTDPTEGSLSTISLNFDATNWDTEQEVTVTGVDDVIIDENITYTIELAVTTTDPNYQSVTPPDVTVTNIDNDVAAFTITPTTGLQTSETGQSDTFTVVMNSMPTANVTMGLSSSDLTEGTVSPTSLTFTPVTWSTAVTVTVTGVDDNLADGSVLYTIVTAPAVSADSNYDEVNAANVSVTNSDDDTAGITASPASNLEVGEGGKSAIFSIVLNTQPTANVTIGISSSDTSEGTVSDNSLTFTPANWSDPQSVTVTGVDDTSNDGNIDFFIVIGPAVSNDNEYDGMKIDNISVRNDDNDPPIIDWVAPVGTEQVYIVKNGETEIELEAIFVGAPPIDHVIFYRWDAKQGKHFTIGDPIEDPPYTTTVEVTSLNYDYNQVFAAAYDPEGDSMHLRILIRRDFIMFLPLASR